MVKKVLRNLKNQKGIVKYHRDNSCWRKLSALGLRNNEKMRIDIMS